jgi:predicted thioredoxin/glutaredoxin
MIKVFTSKHCKPCHGIVERIKEGKFNQDEVDLIDIETPEGFEEFKKEVLDFGDGAVPSAYKDGTRCLISINEEDNVIIDCPNNDRLEAETEKASPD